MSQEKAEALDGPVCEDAPTVIGEATIVGMPESTRPWQDVLAELQTSYDTRLANMKQVIANLDADRARLSARIQRLTVLLETVAEGHPEYTRINRILAEEW